jgi:uncharacterized membrane protein (UPF0127 family)
VIVCAITCLGGACSRVPEEPNPVTKEARPMPTATAKASTSPTPTAAKIECPADPAPQQNASLYGHGKATFVTPDGQKHEFDMEIAASDEAQERGLMYRTSLAPTAGMVFVFGEPHHAIFWMKNTCIALDMVFVGENGKVIGVVTAPPLTTDQRQVPGYSKYVVELAAGVAQERGIAIGTTFIPPPL